MEAEQDLVCCSAGSDGAAARAGVAGRLVYSRKKAAHRARRMAGQGLGPMASGAPRQPDIKPPRVARGGEWPPRRGSPSYESYRCDAGSCLSATLSVCSAVMCNFVRASL